MLINRVRLKNCLRECLNNWGKNWESKSKDWDYT